MSYVSEEMDLLVKIFGDKVDGIFDRVLLEVLQHYHEEVARWLEHCIYSNAHNEFETFKEGFRGGDVLSNGKKNKAVLALIKASKTFKRSFNEVVEQYSNTVYLIPQYEKPALELNTLKEFDCKIL